MPIKPLVSLCIPTNGVAEWVFPVLDSIFEQTVDNSQYEVVITDNGSNQEFKTILKEKYLSQHANLVYEETEAQLFLNEIEAYKRASGELIKFVNHRTRLTKGSLEKLIAFVHEYGEEKPIIYFSNGAITSLDQKRYQYDDFNQFVRELSYWSSWSTGMTIWKSDFGRLPTDTVFNYLFPHTTILFQERTREKYIIDNTIIMDEIPVGNKPKGQYDLFYAFAVEYPGILLDLLRRGDITQETFLHVKRENLKFLSSLYLHFVIRHKPCSYDLSSYGSSIQVFYNHALLLKQLLLVVVEIALNRMKSCNSEDK